MNDLEWIEFYMRVNNLSFDDVAQALKMLVAVRDYVNTAVNDNTERVDNTLAAVN